MTRTRYLEQQGNYGGKKCVPPNAVEKSTCKKTKGVPKCKAKGTIIGHWGEWTPWTGCQGKCGDKRGFRQKIRLCIEGGE